MPERRREVKLDAGLIEEFRRIADERDLPSRAGALYNALADAVRLAGTESGRALLPQETGTRDRGEKLREQWTQPAEEYHQWAARLKAAGSSPRAVLKAWVEEYVRCSGDLPAMRWPFRGAELAAAC